jgi:predicted MFS family arabinose efflux permease
LLFMGQFALFTYLRPFLETVTRVGVSTLSLLLLGMGAAGLLGTYLIGFFVARRLTAVLIAAPLAMAVIAVLLVVLGRSLPATALLLAGWGLIGTAVPVAWWTWLSRTLPHDTEAGGGLMVAAIQLAITAGASIGGQLFDRGGYQSTFVASAALLGGAALLALGRGGGRRHDRGPRTADDTPSKGPGALRGLPKDFGPASGLITLRRSTAVSRP